MTSPYRPHVISNKKHKAPDWPMIPYTDRSADKYEKYNTKPPEEKK